MLSIPYFTCGSASAYPVAPPMSESTSTTELNTRKFYDVGLVEYFTRVPLPTCSI